MKFTSFAIAALSISTNTLNTLAATTSKTTTTTTTVTEIVDVVVTPDGTVVGGTSVDEGSFNTQALLNLNAAFHSSAPASGLGQQQKQCSLSPNVSCNDSGRDIAAAPGSSASDCCNGCNQVPGCTAFTHDQFNSKGEREGTCYFKSSCNSKVPNSNAVSGVLGGTTCTSPGADAYQTGAKLDCCDGQNAILQPCGQDRPNESCFYCPPSRSPRGPDLCTNGRVPMDGKSIWTHQGGSYSCNGSYNDEGFSQCQGDPTSISLDMSHVRQKDNCFAYNTSQKLPFKPSQIRELSFDAQWDQCGDIWAAPIWLTPSSWEINQGQSGEIDFIETCRSNDNYGIKTAIMCDQHLERDNKCYEPNWGNGQSSNGAKHFIGQIDHNSGDWTMHKCDNLNETNVANCQLISRYPRFLFTNNGSKKNMDFHFVSDLWGGDGGDGGFDNCGNPNKPDTTCKYTIANIKLVHK